MFGAIFEVHPNLIFCNLPNYVSELSVENIVCCRFIVDQQKFEKKCLFIIYRLIEIPSRKLNN